MTPTDRRKPARAGTAAIEFGLIFPVLLMIFSGIVDFGFTAWARGRLAAALSSGAAYAMLAGATVNTATLKTAVQDAAINLPGKAVTITGPATYCLNGTPAHAVATASGGACTDGSAPGTYVGIRITYSYQPMSPFYAQIFNSDMVASEMVRLQ